MHQSIILYYLRSAFVQEPLNWSLFLWLILPLRLLDLFTCNRHLSTYFENNMKHIIWDLEQQLTLARGYKDTSSQRLYSPEKCILWWSDEFEVKSTKIFVFFILFESNQKEYRSFSQRGIQEIYSNNFPLLDTITYKSAMYRKGV
jgi:hypothetical protein